MDWAMPELNGLETTRRMKLQSNAPSIILLTQYNFDEYRNAAMTARADGCIAKSEFGMQLVPLVHLLFPELDVPTDRGPGLTDTPVTARPN